MQLKKEYGGQCVSTVMLVLWAMVCLGTDVAAASIAATQFTVENGPPLDFSLHYKPEQLVANDRYALQANLETAGKVRFLSADRIPVGQEGQAADGRILLSMVSDEASNIPDARLVDTYWKAVALHGKPLQSDPEQKELHLILSSSARQAEGFSGCNSFRGGFQQEGESIRFGPMAATMMACEKDMELEQQFLQALAKSQRFVLQGRTLLLFGAENTELLRFEAGYLL